MFEPLDIPDKPSPRAVPPTPAVIAALRERIGRLEQAPDRGTGQPNLARPVLALGVPAVDAVLPGGGLRLDALHETISAGPDTEHAAAATLFTAGLLARLNGPVLWVLRQADLFAPGLAGVGLHPDRVVFAEAGKTVLPIMEEGLRHRGLAAVVAEPVGRISLTASRRLQLAAEQSGVLAVLVRRSQGFDDPVLAEPSAAITRWRVAMLPSAPALRQAPDIPGLGRPRWQLDLMRCRGGEPGSWIVEACDATGCLGMAADLANGSEPAAMRRSA